MLRISGSSCSGVRAAKSLGVGYLLNSSGVTRLTRASVHCADRIVAHSSSKASRWSSAQRASGYAARSRARIWGARAGASGFDQLLNSRRSQLHQGKLRRHEESINRYEQQDGEDPQQEIDEDLRRFKAMMEAGEIPTIEGQPSGPK